MQGPRNFKLEIIVLFFSVLYYSIDRRYLLVESMPLSLGQRCFAVVPARVGGQHNTESHVQLQYRSVDTCIHNIQMLLSSFATMDRPYTVKNFYQTWRKCRRIMEVVNS